MRTLAGPEATVYFANLSVSSAVALTKDMSASKAGLTSDTDQANFSATHIGILALMKEHQVPIEKVCLLDPKAEKELSPKDGDGMFEWFLFGVSTSITRSSVCLVQSKLPNASGTSRVFLVR